MDHRDLVRQHFLGQAGVGPEENRLVHDLVRAGHLRESLNGTKKISVTYEIRYCGSVA